MGRRWWNYYTFLLKEFHRISKFMKLEVQDFDLLQSPLQYCFELSRFVVIIWDETTSWQVSFPHTDHSQLRHTLSFIKWGWLPSCFMEWDSFSHLRYFMLPKVCFLLKTFHAFYAILYFCYWYFTSPLTIKVFHIENGFQCSILRYVTVLSVLINNEHQGSVHVTEDLLGYCFSMCTLTQLHDHIHNSHHTLIQTTWMVPSLLLRSMFPIKYATWIYAGSRKCMFIIHKRMWHTYGVNEKCIQSLVRNPSKQQGDKGIELSIILKLASQDKAVNVSDTYQWWAFLKMALYLCNTAPGTVPM
jgi:hypothetical protein